MKLENKFLSAFFYPFLIGIILSIIIVAFIIYRYSNNYLDIKSAEDIYTLEKTYATININSINVLLSNALLKVQVGLHEQLTFYENIANQIDTENIRLQSTINSDVKNVIELLNNTSLINPAREIYYSIWFVDKNLTENKLVKKDNLYQQISVYSQLTQSLYSVWSSMNDILLNIYFLFEDTNLYIGYPYKYYNDIKSLPRFLNYMNNPTWCTDERGNIIDYYKFRCRDFFNDIMKSKEDMFDLNIKSQSDRKIFITSPYQQFGIYASEVIFTICIQFEDSLSKKDAYICGDINGINLFDSFDSFNEKLIGYFSIASVGFNNAFYFPQMSSSGYGKTLGEYIFRWDKDYYLEEKLDFINIIQKIITSNYYDSINKEEIQDDPINIFNEIYIDDTKGENQYFYLNRDKYNYCIFPIILEDYNKKFEHVLSIVYLFNKKLFYQNMLSYQSSSSGKLVLELILFFFFGAVLLYLIILSFKLLAKFIVIPIKNVQYMLEGINIGGEYRLEFLNNLKKKQEDNLEKLNKINHQLMQKNEKNKRKNNEYFNDEKDKNNFITKSTMKEKDAQGDKSKDNKDGNNEDDKNKNNFILEKKTMKNINLNNAKTIRDDEKLLNTSTEVNEDNTDMNLEYNGELINPKINYDKQYDLDGDVIEKELNFYDFDEELLQFRPIEIDRLVQSLLNLKSALILTSSDHEVENIIDYSNCEYIFNNFKNKEGSRMCQSNIGNLQSQLLKYDKAIYHLALSLQNVELKKFLSLTLSDEIDESDSLLHKIEMNYSKNSKEKEMNELVKKQQNSKHKNFSQKVIGILINSRYNKLINIYFRFFSFIQKSNYNYEKLSGYFMHTNYHTINYYHKTIIQYVYLCFVSNDLVKIGESILDYIEFLIKFKLKTSKENKYILNVSNKDIPEIKEKQSTKKKYFDKVISWFSLFESYAKQINENSALGNYKDVIDAYTHNVASSHNEFNSGNQSALLFQVNLQRCDFLKGKFALVCKNYSDAIGYFISAAKKKRIVLDGLIKKRALKHIFKIAKKAKTIIEAKNYSNMNYNEIFNTLNFNSKKKAMQINNNNLENNLIGGNEEKIGEDKKDIRLRDKMDEIIKNIEHDKNECNEKQLKDIIILIDCNSSNKLTVDSFIDVTKTILKNYLTNNDRLGVFLLINENRIICPMMCKCEIDTLNFSKDLDTYSEKLFRKERLDSSLGREIIRDRLEVDESDKYTGSQDSFSSEYGENKDYNSYEMEIEETIKSMNYCINYLKMKEINTNEKFFIYFNTNIKKIMDYLKDTRDNSYMQESSYESNNKKKVDIHKDKKIHFLLVGKINSEENEPDVYKKTLLQYFGSKSEIIPFDNMKKIKSILSSNSIINDNVIFPNEVYK